MDTTETVTPPTLEINTSRQMLSWLSEQKLSIALTTYQIGKLYFIGLKPDNGLPVFEETLIKSQKLVKYAVDRNHCKGAH